MTNDPGGEQSAARSASYRELFGIHVTTRRNGINAGHQILEIVTRVTRVDDIAELFAVSSRAPWICVEDDEAARSLNLKFIPEFHNVHGMRSAVNV